ncbi:hypothetical protein CASFOL_027244 [Castilleja foliolosa]|uniref:Cystatin domain-containing protein n=1 Tax=Castilleja foliolosa TaxID=1961234 RepID=A0ABD3CE92_9LAMI
MILKFSLPSFIFILVLVVIPIEGKNCRRPTIDEDKYAPIGGWEPLTNLKDPEALMSAKFAVTEHNKQAKTSLICVTLIGGRSKLVEGSLFQLVISAKDGSVDEPKLYLVEVWSRVWLKKQPLILDSFKEI